MSLTISSAIMGGNNISQSVPSARAVAQALEIARDSAEGARDPVVCNILEAAIADIWGKVQAQPNTYLMTRDEFAVFNYFQHRFAGCPVAIAARKRYWDYTGGSNGS